ncbi:hypothetical protein FACS189491_11660 [Spirochaetia bacterium]|nr:hypothetical protein FACS189491_11660 [Spirochaetia bacterium]
MVKKFFHAFVVALPPVYLDRFRIKSKTMLLAAVALSAHVSVERQSDEEIITDDRVLLLGE